MPEQELDLLDFATRGMAELRTGPPQIVWGKMFHPSPLGTSPDHVPDDVLGDAFSPGRSKSANGPEDPALANLGRDDPTIDPPP